MVWYKAWLETRWRFLIGLGLVVLGAMGAVFTYPQVASLVTLGEKVDATTRVGRAVVESAHLSRTYAGYIWSQWFGQNLPQYWTVFALMLGSGGLLTQASRGGALYTLSLPASRNELVWTRAAVSLAELAALAIVPALVLPLMSPAVGQTYALGDALVYGVCLFVGGTVLFSATFLLSTVFSDMWKPFLIVLLVAMFVAVCRQIIPALGSYTPFGVMSAETYFRGGTLPWAGLIVSALVSGVLLIGAARNIARQDF